MILQNPPSQRINRLLSMQDNVAMYYEKMAELTTEQNLQRIFFALQKYHVKVKKNLEKTLYSQSSLTQLTFKKSKSLIRKLWKEVLISVLVKNQEELIEYCRQSEITLLQELNSIINRQNADNEITKILVDHEENICTYLEKLAALPNDKTYRKVA